MKQVGTAKPGYPVKMKMTFYDENNQPQNTHGYEVVELSKATLDAALFDVPADYKLQNGSGSPIAASVLKAKAKSNGDDLISNLVEQAATMILAVATKR